MTTVDANYASWYRGVPLLFNDRLFRPSGHRLLQQEVRRRSRTLRLICNKKARRSGEKRKGHGVAIRRILTFLEGIAFHFASHCRSFRTCARRLSRSRHTLANFSNQPAEALCQFTNSLNCRLMIASVGTGIVYVVAITAHYSCEQRSSRRGFFRLLFISRKRDRERCARARPNSKRPTQLLRQ